MPDNLVIADTSCLILLSKVNELNILKSSYRRVIVTPEIATEFNEQLPDWIEVLSVKDRGLQLLLQESLDIGESSAIALAWEIEDATIILDDLKARKIAYKMGLKITGTIGVIVKAKQKGLIPSVKDIIKRITNTDFRINSKTIEEAIKQAGELP